MYCLTRRKMKFGDVEIPARTKGYVIENDKKFYEPNCHVQLNIFIPFRHLGNIKNIINDLEEKSGFRNYTATEMNGYSFHTKTNEIYLDAEDRRYYNHKISKWKADLLFPGNKLDDFKEYIKPLEKFKNKWDKDEIFLDDVIGYLELQMINWVEQNGEFRVLEEGDEQLDYGDWEVGDRLLVNVNDFNTEKLHIQGKLEEATGFTYDFDGGLIWE